MRDSNQRDERLGTLPDAKTAATRHPRQMADLENTNNIRLTIELRGHGEPIEGQLVEPMAHAAPFRGWLALTSLIESVRLDSGPPDGRP